MPLLVVGMLALFSLPERTPFEVLEHGQYDLLFQGFHDAPPVDDRLVLFQMDDTTARSLGYPVPRATHGQLARSLAATGVVRAMVWDVIWAEPSEGDAELAAGFATIPVALGMGTVATTQGLPEGSYSARDLSNFVVGSSDHFEAWEADPRIPSANFTKAISVDQIRLAAAAGGHVRKAVDYGGVFRRVNLIEMIESCVERGGAGCEKTEHVPIPALGLAGVLLTLGVPNDDIQWRDGTLRIGERTLEQPIDVPLDSQGRLLINHMENWQDSLDRREYSAQFESLEYAPELMAEGLENKTIIVGGVYSGVGDFAALPHEREPVPGVLITVNVMNTILTGSFLREVPRTYVWGLTLVIALFLGGLATLARPATVGIVALLFAVAMVVVPMGLFLSGIYLATPIPLLANLLTAGFIAAIGHTREHRRASNTSRILSRFVSPALLNELEANGNREFLPEPQRQEITVLFADIASFTPFTEASDPEALSAFLDQFYEMSMDVLFAHQGTLDKFQGDGVLAYFGAPEPIAAKEEKAVRSALAICDRFYELRARHEMASDLGIRCGIATGVSAVGYFGGLRYANYTIVGHYVNMAARLQGQARVGDILIDQGTAKKLPDGLSIEELESIRLKGIAEPVPVWRVAQAQKSVSSQSTSSSESSDVSPES